MRGGHDSQFQAKKKHWPVLRIFVVRIVQYFMFIYLLFLFFPRFRYCVLIIGGILYEDDTFAQQAGHTNNNMNVQGQTNMNKK